MKIFTQEYWSRWHYPAHEISEACQWAPPAFSKMPTIKRARGAAHLQSKTRITTLCHTNKASGGWEEGCSRVSDKAMEVHKDILDGQQPQTAFGLARRSWLFTAAGMAALAHGEACTAVKLHDICGLEFSGFCLVCVHLCCSPLHNHYLTGSQPHMATGADLDGLEKPFSLGTVKEDETMSRGMMAFRDPSINRHAACLLCAILALAMESHAVSHALDMCGQGPCNRQGGSKQARPAGPASAWPL
jgi:hypothetical protein